MVIKYVEPIKAQRMQVIINRIDAADPLPGRLVFVDALNNVLARIQFVLPSFENDGDGQVTMRSGPRSVNASATGSIASARLEDGDGNIVGQGLSVAPVGNVDVLVSAMFLTAGNLVTVYSGRITHG